MSGVRTWNCGYWKCMPILKEEEFKMPFAARAREKRVRADESQIDLSEDGPIRPPAKLPYRSTIPFKKIDAAVRMVIARRKALQRQSAGNASPE